MKKIAIVSLSFLFIYACKKEVVEVEHNIQFQSNILTVPGSYYLTIDGVSSDINTSYKLKENSSVHLLLARDTSTVWLTGTIYADGKAVKYDEGYKDTIDLNYSVK